MHHIFKAPLPTINAYIDGYTDMGSNFGAGALIKKFKGDRLQLTNIENLQPWMIKHDKWSIQVGTILGECEELAYLNVKDVYLDFGKFIGYEPLGTNHALLFEGAVQHHCVGTYSSNVNSGACGIFNIDGYTLDVRFGESWDYDAKSMVTKLRINQFRGLRNALAPLALKEMIQGKINEFNTDIGKYQASTSMVLEVDGDDEDIF
jgi:hypothetical protein